MRGGAGVRASVLALALVALLATLAVASTSTIILAVEGMT